MPPEYAGGIGFDGVAALRAFVEKAERLFAIDAASTLPIRYFDIPVRDALDGVRNTEFYCPGLAPADEDRHDAAADGRHAGRAGGLLRQRPRLRRRAARGVGSAMTSPTSNAGHVAASTSWRATPSEPEDVLMSGWINGANRIAGKAAAVDVSLGRGHVVLTGFGVWFRGQPHGTFKFLFNPILESAAEAPDCYARQ